MVREKCAVPAEARLVKWCHKEQYHDIISLQQVDIEFPLLFFMASKMKRLRDRPLLYVDCLNKKKFE